MDLCLFLSIIQPQTDIRSVDFSECFGGVGENESAGRIIGVVNPSAVFSSIESDSEGAF